MYKTMRDIEFERRTRKVPPTHKLEIRLPHTGKSTKEMVDAITEKLKAKLPKPRLVIWMPRNDSRLELVIDKRLSITQIDAAIKGIMVTKYQTRGTKVTTWYEFP